MYESIIQSLAAFNNKIEVVKLLISLNAI